MKKRNIMRIIMLATSFFFTTQIYGNGDMQDNMADKIKMIKNSIADARGLVFKSGPFGTVINGQTFQQEAIVSFNGYQYAAYFSEGGTPCIARRKLPEGEWKTLCFTDYKIGHDDVHNVAVVEVCPEDGTIHLSYDHHCSDLHYRRSVPGLATRPEEFEWKISNFGKTVSSLEAGHHLRMFTYPQFFRTPKGKLQLLYRIGISGDGDWYLAEYDPGNNGWTTLGMLFSRKGEYDTSNSRCAYPNQLRYDRESRLTMTWCWRERPANGVRDLRTNNDLCYAYSNDFGRTWKNDKGDIIAVLGGDEKNRKPITVDSEGSVVMKTRFLWGQMNVTTHFVDKKGRIHVIHWQHDQKAEKPSADLNTWKYYHYWKDENGSWKENVLPFVGRKPQIILDDTDNAYVLYNRNDENRKYHGTDPGGHLTIQSATGANNFKDWKILWTSEEQFLGEPLYDPIRWSDKHVLSVYAQEKPEQAGTPAPLRVIDFDFRD